MQPIFSMCHPPDKLEKLSNKTICTLTDSACTTTLEICLQDFDLSFGILFFRLLLWYEKFSGMQSITSLHYYISIQHISSLCTQLIQKLSLEHLICSFTKHTAAIQGKSK